MDRALFQLCVCVFMRSVHVCVWVCVSGEDLINWPVVRLWWTTRACNRFNCNIPLSACKYWHFRVDYAFHLMHWICVHKTREVLCGCVCVCLHSHFFSLCNGSGGVDSFQLNVITISINMNLLNEYDLRYRNNNCAGFLSMGEFCIPTDCDAFHLD